MDSSPQAPASRPGPGAGEVPSGQSAHTSSALDPGQETNPDPDETLRVSLLSTTPVKGFALHHPHRIELDDQGAVGDRDFFLVDDRNRLFSITRTGAFAGWSARWDSQAETLTFRPPGDGPESVVPAQRGKPLVAHFFDDRSVPGHVIEGPWNDQLSEVAGEPVRVVRAKQPGEGSDTYPVTLLGDASVDALTSHAGAPVDRRRFRMLIGFTGSAAFDEDSWRHRRLRLGTAVLRVGGPVPRCAGTNRNPDSGDADFKTLHLINDLRGRTPNEWGDALNLGVYATVEQPGVISVGDLLDLE